MFVTMRHASASLDTLVSIVPSELAPMTAVAMASVWIGPAFVTVDGWAKIVACEAAMVVVHGTTIATMATARATLAGLVSTAT